MKAWLFRRLPPAWQASALLGALLKFRRSFVAVAVISAVANLLLLAPTVYLLQLFDRVLASRNELTLLVVSLVTLFLLAMMVLADWTRRRMLVRVGFHFDDRLGDRVFAAGFEHSLRRPGRTQMQGFTDLAEVRKFFTGTDIVALLDAPWAPIFVGVLFLLHPWLGVAALVFIGMQYGVMWVTRRYTQPSVSLANQKKREESVFVTGKLRHAQVLHSMGMFGSVERLWWDRHRAAIGSATASFVRRNLMRNVSKGIRVSQQSLTIGLGALLVIQGELSVGAMIAANMLMRRTLAPADKLVSLAGRFPKIKEAFLRLDELLQNQRSPMVASAASDKPAGRIELRAVSAKLPGTPTPLIQGIDLTLEPGQTTVVMGASGSGKSTLARVILGLWPDVEGDILLDGVPMRNWTRDQLGPHIGYLPQDVAMFEGTIAENIARMSTPDPVAVVAAARETGLHEMILRLPKGYETPMGEAGHVLSGGQMQRLGLTRAVYGNPSLVVLDEPNAHLDERGEKALAKAIQQLTARGSSVLLITHRQGIVRLANRLVFMQEGRIVLQGPRRETWLKWKQINAQAKTGTAPDPLKTLADQGQRNDG